MVCAVTYELTLAPTVASIGAGRRLVSAALAEWGLDELDYTATLLTSEVLTNSLLHARTPIVLRIERTDPTTVTICVHDGSPIPPRRRLHADDATTGRGIELLNALSQSWRVQPESDGKTVSFTIDRAHDPWAAYAGSDCSDAR